MSRIAFPSSGRVGGCHLLIHYSLSGLLGFESYLELLPAIELQTQVSFA